MRLVELTDFDEVLVSPEIRRLIAPYFEIEAGEAIGMKFKAEVRKLNTLRCSESLHDG